MKYLWLYALSLILALGFILPLFYILNFVYLFADDYCRATLNFSEFGTNLWDWYLFHNGRYMNAVFSLLPVYKIGIYRAVLAMNVILLGVTLYQFLLSVVKSYKISLENAELIFLTVIFYIVIIAQLPSLFEYFFWYAAATAYLLSFIFFLLFLSNVLRFCIGGELNFYSLGLLIILLNGNNEIFLGITNFLLLVILVWDVVRHPKRNTKLVLLNILSWISTLAVIFSPGSLTRRAHYDYGGNLYGSIKVAIIYGGEFIIENLLKLPFIFLFVIAFLLVYYKGKIKPKQFIKPLYLLLISYFCIISMFFILYYARGLLGVQTGRIGNIVTLVVLTFIFLNILNLAVFFTDKGTFKILNLKWSLILFSGFLIIFLFFRNTNYQNIHDDFKKEEFSRYEEDMKKRIEILQESREKEIVLQPVMGTKVLKSDDGIFNAQEWLRDCYKFYFKLNTSPEVKIIPE